MLAGFWDRICNEKWFVFQPVARPRVWSLDCLELNRWCLALAGSLVIKVEVTLLSCGETGESFMFLCSGEARSEQLSNHPVDNSRQERRKTSGIVIFHVPLFFLGFVRCAYLLSLFCHPIPEEFQCLVLVFVILDCGVTCCKLQSSMKLQVDLYEVNRGMSVWYCHLGKSWAIFNQKLLRDQETFAMI